MAHSELSKLIDYCQKFTLEGQNFLRQNSHLEFCKHVVQSIRNGNNAQQIVTDSIPIIQNLNIEFQRIRHFKIALFSKIIFIFLLLFSIRILILNSIDEHAWVELAATDRIICIAVSTTILCIAIPIHEIWKKFGISIQRQHKLRDLFFDYIQLGKLGPKFSEHLKQQIRSIKKSEMLYGTPSHELIDQLFKDTFAQELFRIQQILPKLSFLLLSIELMFFVLSGLAMLTVPLLAWVETSQTA